MVEHMCRGSWAPGPVAACLNHARPGRALNLDPFDQRTNTITDGIASTGQMSPKGTVAHTEHFDGRVDATASVRPVTAKLSDLRRQHERRNG